MVRTISTRKFCLFRADLLSLIVQICVSFILSYLIGLPIIAFCDENGSASEQETDTEVGAQVSNIGVRSYGESGSNTEAGSSSRSRVDLNMTASPNPRITLLMEQFEADEKKLDILLQRTHRCKEEVLSDMKELAEITERGNKIFAELEECYAIDRIRQEEEAQQRAKHEDLRRQVDPTLLQHIEEQKTRRRTFRERLPDLEQKNWEQFNRDRGRYR